MAISLINAGPATVVAQESDLPYAMVTLSVWEVSSGLPTGITVAGIIYIPEVSQVQVALSNDSNAVYDVPLGATELTINDLATAPEGDYPVNIVLSRLSALQLLDRAVNAVAVSSETTLALPALVSAGKARDFYLKMTVAGSQDVSFSPSSGVAYTGYGNPAKTYSTGAYVLHFRETAENEFCVTNMLAEYAAAHHVHSADDITSGTLDAARLPVATASSKGAVQVDGTTITVANGVISAVGGGGGGGGGGAVAMICMTSKHAGGTSNQGQHVTVGGRNYCVAGDLDTAGPYLTVVPVFEGETVSVDYIGYRHDSSLYKNGEPATSEVPSTLTAGDVWTIVFGECLAYGTLVLMADGTLKRIEDMSVGDVVAAVDPSDGSRSSDVVSGVSRGVGTERIDWTFDGGRTVSTVGRHRFWNVGLGEMLYLEAWNLGEVARVSDGTDARLVSKAASTGKFRHASLWTEKWNNYFANGLLAGNRRTVKGAY